MRVTFGKLPKWNRLEAFYVAVLLKGRKNDVEEPEAEEAISGDFLTRRRTAQLTAGNLGATADDEEDDGDDGEDTEDGETESERSWRDGESSFGFDGPVVNRGHGPCNTDSEEDVDTVGSGHVSDRRISVLILDGGDF